MLNLTAQNHANQQSLSAKPTLLGHTAECVWECLADLVAQKRKIYRWLVGKTFWSQFIAGPNAPSQSFPYHQQLSAVRVPAYRRLTYFFLCIGHDCQDPHHACSHSTREALSAWLILRVPFAFCGFVSLYSFFLPIYFHCNKNSNDVPISLLNININSSLHGTESSTRSILAVAICEFYSFSRYCLRYYVCIR